MTTNEQFLRAWDFLDKMSATEDTKYKLAAMIITLALKSPKFSDPAVNRVLAKFGTLIPMLDPKLVAAHKAEAEEEIDSLLGTWSN